MTLIECFDPFAPQNIASCLHLRPEKLILVGDQAQLGTFPDRCKSFLKARGIRTQVRCCHVPMDRMEQMVRTLTELVREEEDCVIDIAGGEERLMMAVGVVLTGLDSRQQEKIRVQEYDLESGTIRLLKDNTVTQLPAPAQLTVEELVYLQGGTLHPEPSPVDSRYTAADLDGLWALMCRDPQAWNLSLSALGDFESRSASKEQVFLRLDWLRSSMSDYHSDLPLVRTLLAGLEKCGAIRDQSRGDYLEYTYTSPLMRTCTRKVGNILEHKALLEARGLRLDGKSYFHDCRMGVHIDWDGQIHNKREIPETRNEVDLVLMRGMMPLFVSCKNGDIKDGELYKLHTVATRFGGPYARKMLIATEVQGNEQTIGALRQRAEDMGIHLVTNAARLTKQGWAEAFQKAMQGGNKK